MTIKGVRVGICGLGLIGGSLAKAFHNKCGINSICALDSNKKSIEQAIKDGVISSGSDNYNIFSDCDIVFICTPIDEVVKCATLISKFSKAIITDTASTKSEILLNIPSDLRFIGGHPMAGAEVSGYNSSNDLLFENAIYVVIKPLNIAENDYNLLLELIKGIGAVPMELQASEHDKAVGMISHLPHIVAATLVNTVRGADNSVILKQLAAGGFKDITRIASSNANLWKQIIMSSDDTIIDILKQYINQIESLIKIIKNKDDETLIEFLSNAKEYRDAIALSKKGLLGSVAELYIEVSDKPGIIGKVTTILGNSGINISNLYIENNREYEGGCLRITLEKAIDSDRAVNILKENNLVCRAK